VFAKTEGDPWRSLHLGVTFLRFYAIGLVNSQNTRMWSRENTHADHENPLHTSECSVRCLAVGLLGPLSSETLLTRYTTLTECMNFSDVLLKRILSKQCATCLTAWAIMRQLSFLFGDRIISKGRRISPTSLRFMEPHKRQSLPQ
jgi:hypothetical protein